MKEISKLVRMNIVNIGCIGPEGCAVALDNILCLVGPNNSGKSTILRAYELALGSVKFEYNRDLCRRADGQSAYVEIWVHIPEGMENIAEKWKIMEGNLRLVRSKWEWSESSGWSQTRTTWNPEIDEYSSDDKASGLDAVFNSRLPKPFRIGSLEEPVNEHSQLLSLILDPISQRLKSLIDDDKSALNTAIRTIEISAKEPIKYEQEKLKELKADLNKSHNMIFPDLKIDFQIDIGNLKIDPLKMLKENSSIVFSDWDDIVPWQQQGTGSQRALFWTMLQVRSKLKAIADANERKKKEIADISRSIKKLEKELETAKKNETKFEKKRQIDALKERIDLINTNDDPETTGNDDDKLILPGYMLLIDEPEIALHPNAIRSACKYLYNLANDAAWQVMFATHSPLFVNPTNDHTTIVRLERSAANPTPRIFRSEQVSFSESEKEELKLLNLFDQNLAEMFFGQLPILVEGDTEFSVFQTIISKYGDIFPNQKRPVIVRTRGKGTLLSVMKILREFIVPFSILHDSDSPFTKNGQNNGAWTLNNDIHELILSCRDAGIKVIHRVSIPNFEYAYDNETDEYDIPDVEQYRSGKPWHAINKMRRNTTYEASLVGLLKELVDENSRESPFDGKYIDELSSRVKTWATKNKPNDPRFFGI